MAYQRKTRDVWWIETNSGYGWDIDCAEYSLKDARAQAKCYRENACGRFEVRITKHREQILEEV